MLKLDGSIFRFIIVGVLNTLFGTTIMFVFYNVFHLSYWVSSASNYFFGSILSYFLNKSFTFRYGKTDLKSLVKFAVNILVCYLLAYGIAKPLVRHLMEGYDVNLQENFAMLTIAKCRKTLSITSPSNAASVTPLILPLRRSLSGDAV